MANNAPMPTPVFHNYCLECGWAANERELSRSELARATVDHAIDTGHDIDSEFRAITGDGADSAGRIVLYWDE